MLLSFILGFFIIVSERSHVIVIVYLIVFNVLHRSAGSHAMERFSVNEFELFEVLDLSRQCQCQVFGIETLFFRSQVNIKLDCLGTYRSLNENHGIWTHLTLENKCWVN